MDNPTEGDTVFLYLSILVLVILIAGLVIHSFIIAVNVNDWLKGRSVTPVDHIIGTLGILRICAQCVVTVRLVFFVFIQENLYSQVASVVIRAFYSLFLYANVWLTSLLSIVFCLKISNLHTGLFLYLRRVIEHRTAYFIVASVFASTLNYLLPLLSVINEMSKGGTYNITIDILSECKYIIFLYSFTIGSFVPLLFFIISSVLLFASLYHHATKMKISGNSSINLETYYSAMKFVFITFIYNIIYTTVYYVSVFYYYLYCMSTVWFYVLLGFLPALHSSYLIYRTAKLRSQMSKVLQNVIDFLFQKKNPETREEIEIVAQ